MESSRRIFRVNRRDISYLRYTVESYDGLAQVSTLDPYYAKIEITISRGGEALLSGLVDSLSREEGLLIEEISG